MPQFLARDDKGISQHLGQNFWFQVLAFLCWIFAPITAPSAAPPHGVSEAGWQRWLAINYYQPESTSKSRQYQSEIINADYFLAPQGQQNPEAELQTFLQILNDENGTETACRYPARLSWAYQYLAHQLQRPRPQCPEFEKSSNPSTIKEISLLFASGYFESPASAFGHILLKFAPEANLFTDYFMDSSLNYGANTQGQDVGVRYIFNGLMGGYSASYQRNNAFLNTQNYTARQQRDVWEYPLKLNTTQRQFVIEHSYELKRARFTYYFLTDNCAHRIARMLELATHGQFKAAGKGPWLQPGQVVQALQQQGWLTSETRHISLKAQARNAYQRLPRAEQRLMQKAMQGTHKITDLTDQQLQLLNMLLDTEAASYANKAKQANKYTKLQQLRQEVLLARLARPPLPVSERLPLNPAVSASATTPATAAAPAKLTVAQKFKESAGSTFLTYRAANHDLLDTPVVGQPPSKFIFGEVTGEIGNNGAKLHSAVLLDIISLNPAPLPQVFGTERSWGLKVAYSPQSKICEKCSTAMVEGKLGQAATLGKNTTVFALLGGQLNSRETSRNEHLMAVLEIGAVRPLGPLQSLATYRASVGPFAGSVQNLAALELAYPANATTTLQLRAEHDGKAGAVVLGVGLELQ